MSLPANQDLLAIFNSFLLESGLSNVSIKNYLSDVRHFLRFVSTQGDVNLTEVFQTPTKYINKYISEQKDLLTPLATTNRRLASIRRFSTFLQTKFEIVNSEEIKNNSNESNQNKENETDKNISSQKILDQFRQNLINEKKTPSTVKNYLSDLYHYFSWIAKHTPFNSHHLNQILSTDQLNGYVSYLKLIHTGSSVISRRQSSIKKLTHYCFAQKFISHDPFETVLTDIKISPLSWFTRLIPKPKTDQNAPKGRLANTYYKYNSLSFTPYLHLALLVLATTAMSILFYNQIIKQAKPSSAATSLTPPKRQLSFQGRLSDSGGTPIVTSVNVNFKLWDQLSAGTEGTCSSAGGEDCLYKTGTCSVTPDQDGIFNSLIGDTVCGAEIPRSVFADNRDIYLEVVVGSETLTPRQQIATVGYALNSETLQGYPASASATINTVPVVDNSGNINIAVTSPSLISSSGNFNIRGQSLSLTTAVNSGGDIVLQPDAIGSGQILAIGGTTTEDTFRITNANLTSGSLISGYIGNNTATGSGNLLQLSSGATETAKFRVTADGRTTITTATASANTSALIVDQNGTGNIFSASSSGVTKFLLNNLGGITMIDGVSHTIDDISGNLTLTSNSSTISLNDSVTFASTTTLNGLTYTWPGSQTANYVLQTNGSGSLSWVAQNGGSSTLWDQQNGTLYPLNSTVDFLLGGQSTASAQFAVLNLNNGTPTASISSDLVDIAMFIDGNGNISTTNRQSLVLGNSSTYNSTGNILLNPNGTGNVGIGTTNPTSKLDVIGTVTASDFSCTDCLDYTELADTMALDANLITNQSTYTATQNFTGTTTDGFTYNANSLTSGDAVNIFSTSTALTTGNLLGIDWSPGSSTTATGDLFSLNIGTNGNIGNLFNIKDTGSSLFSVSETTVTSNLPTSFTSPGDVSLSYDLVFTNPTASYVKSAAPVYIQAGETYNSSDLNLQTYNKGNTIVDSEAFVANHAATVSGTLTVGGTTTFNSQTYTWPASAGSNTYVLQTNGSGTLSWVAQSGGSSYWNQTLGSLYAMNSTVDFFVGGQSTDSAKFKVINMNSGTPTASIAGTVANQTTFFDGNGNISTTARQSLVLGNSSTYNSTGNILLNPNGTGNVGIGTTAPISSFSIGAISEFQINSTGNIIKLNNVTTSFPSSQGAANSSLTNDGSGNLSWLNPSGTGISGFWQRIGSNIFPTNIADNVGIGTTAPSQRLDVAGVFVVDTTNGRVGIGTTAPTTTLDIAGVTSTISNSSGDITLNAASNFINFSGDSLNNILDATISGSLYVGSANQFKINSSGNIVKLNNVATSFPSSQGGSNSSLTNDGSGNLSWLSPTDGIGVNGFWQRTSRSLSPTNIYDSLNVGAIATSSALVHLGGISTENSFFMNPVAIGFNSAITNQGIGGGSTALQVDGDILPGVDDDAFLGRGGTAWNRLYLSNGINNSAGTEQINILNRQLVGGQWNATTTLRVGDTTASMPTGREFYVVGDASVSATFFVGGTTDLLGTVTVGNGTGKIDVGTVDPPYTINGEKYATYLSGMIGVKEEVTGNLATNEYVPNLGYRKTINFNNQTKGSDLWLFGKTTDIKNNLNRTSVLLTPNGQAKTWYQTDNTNNILYVYSSSPTEISFRLSAPRFDDASWTNTRNSTADGFIINDPDEFVSNSETIVNIDYSTQIANIDGSYKLFSGDKEIKDVSSFSSSIIANLRAGLAVISELAVDNLTIKNKLISPLANIDQLNVKDATVSGNLFADNIKSKTIDKLSEQLGLLDEKYSTASAILATLQDRVNSYENDPLQLSPLSTTSATLPENLITGDILANGSIFTQSLSSFDTDLFIQPSGDKPVHLLANLMTLYPNGQVVIEGDLLVTGNIYANNLDTRTATVSGNLAVSGSANFGELTTNGLVIASDNNSEASISGQTNSNSTIGMATIASGSSEIIINSSKITDTTLVYITPVSDTGNQVLFVKSKQTGTGFVVAVPQPVINETSFNYWLVQTK